jgi:hypothetical protein
MDKAIKLQGKLPGGDANGLNDPEVVRRLLGDPNQMRVAIVLFTVPKVETDTEAETEVGKATVKRIEVLLDDATGDASTLRRVLMRNWERRKGETTLDADLEQAVQDAFDGINPVDFSKSPDDEQ